MAWTGPIAATGGSALTPAQLAAIDDADLLGEVQDLDVQSAAPTTPAAGKVTQPYFRDDAWKWTDESGVERAIGPTDLAPSTGVIAAAKGLTVSRAADASNQFINASADEILLTTPEGMGRVVTNIDLTRSMDALAPNSWGELWLVENIAGTGRYLLVQAENAGKPANAYSARLSVFRVNAVTQLPALVQIGSTVYYTGPGVINSTTQVATPTAIDMSAAVPASAQEVIFHHEANRTAAGTTVSYQFQPIATASAGYMQIITSDASSTTQRYLRRDRMHFRLPQQMFFTRATGAWTLGVFVSGYAL